MAGDWIKMRESLHEDPAVLYMASSLNVSSDEIVGKCHRFWAWVSRNCHDGSVTLVTLSSLGWHLGMLEFLELLVEVGWLEEVDLNGKVGLKIPNFDRHLSESAKKRGLASDRKRKQREPDARESRSSHAPVTQVSRCERDKSVTREEKRREEYKNTLTRTREREAPPPQILYESMAPRLETAMRTSGLLGEGQALTLVASPNRLQRLREIHEQFNLDSEAMTKALEKALAGAHVSHKGSHATLDWFIHPDRLDRLLEGKFSEPHLRLQYSGGSSNGKHRGKASGGRPPYQSAQDRHRDEKARKRDREYPEDESSLRILAAGEG